MSNHVTIVTGASKGIGKAIVEILLENKSKVIAVARSGDLLKQLAEKHGEENLGFVVGDVTNEESAKLAVDLAVNKFGQLNSLILNCGILEPVGKIESTSIKDWKRLYDVNFFSIVQLIQIALPELKKAHGNIIAVSSGASTKSYSGWSAYGSSKAALNHLIQSIAFDEPEIKTISIAPGVVDTSMQEQIRNEVGVKMSKEGLQRFIELHEKGQLVKPEEPARVLVQLALNGWPDHINGKYLRNSIKQGSFRRFQSSIPNQSPENRNKARALIILGSLALGSTLASFYLSGVKDTTKDRNISVIFVLGGPGSGKGTQCDKLVKERGFVHLSAGDLLRAEQNRQGSKYGDLIAKCIKDGSIVPQEVTVQLLKNAIDEYTNQGKTKFLVDGFPRKMDQAITFENTIVKSAFTLFFECPEQVMLKRLLARGKTSGRTDDNIESIQKRFKTFIDTSMPVVDYYDKQGKVVKVNCNEPVDVVFNHVKQALKNRDI
ncbi:unnamed protein product [Candida verbasci]|uniref:Uridylate kinase n=1 Tax=Candida verbasci TaxID=1227364 RepID=A0A9W4TVD4_9ASCO|nr:unnamed protein product [Candida verbasci]